MLHGYTQSGDLFRAKTGALTKHIQKSLPQYEVQFSYPTGPIRLAAADIPGYTPSKRSRQQQQAFENGIVDDEEGGVEEEEIEAYGWWRRSNTSDPPEYRGLDLGIKTIASVLRTEGPFDGVIGFSQGASAAAMMASLLELPERKETFDRFRQEIENEYAIPFPGEELIFVQEPGKKEQNQLPRLKFAICYSGFVAPGNRYRAFYEQPKIATPVLHVIGSLDAVVDESRTRALIDACEGTYDEKTRLGRIVLHPGGHFVPSQKPYLDTVTGFIKACLGGHQSNTSAQGKCRTRKGIEDEGVEDMDVPF